MLGHRKLVILAGFRKYTNQSPAEYEKFQN